MFEPLLPKCGIYGSDKEQVGPEAARLRIAHQLDGFNAVGTPLGSAEYVSNALGWLACSDGGDAGRVTGAAPALCTVPDPVPVSLTARTHGARHAGRASGGACVARTARLPGGLVEYGLDMEGQGVQHPV